MLVMFAVHRNSPPENSATFVSLASPPVPVIPSPPKPESRPLAVASGTEGDSGRRPREGLHMKALTSVRDESRPRLVVDTNFAETVSVAAQKAEAGDSRAALQLSDLTNPLGGSARLPAGVSDDRLHWLRLAADSGSLEAMIRFANDVGALPFTLGTEKLKQLDPSLVAQLEVEARKYLARALEQGVPDAFPIAFSALRDGRLGFQPDPVAAHACLLVFAREFSGDVPRRLVQQNAAKLRPADIALAEGRAAQSSGCSIVL